MKEDKIRQDKHSHVRTDTHTHTHIQTHTHTNTHTPIHPYLLSAAKLQINKVEGANVSTLLNWLFLLEFFLFLLFLSSLFCELFLIISGKLPLCAADDDKLNSFTKCLF